VPCKQALSVPPLVEHSAAHPIKIQNNVHHKYFVHTTQFYCWNSTLLCTTTSKLHWVFAIRCLQQSSSSSFVCRSNFQSLPATEPHHHLQRKVWTNHHPALSASMSLQC